MKRLMPSSLISFLQTTSHLNVLKADLFAITLPTGTTIYATEGQWDITLTPYNPSTGTGTPGWEGSTTTFKATQYGRWSRGAITSEAGFDCKANTMELTCVPQPGTAYPGMTVGLLNAALNGLFDAATVTVYTAYMPLGSYGNVSAGIETKFSGTITKLSDINRTRVVFECADPLYLLNMKVPTRLFKAGCPWSFADSNCTLNAANYTVAFTAKTGSTQSVLTPVTAFTQAAGYFTQGVVTCTAGANAGLSQTVKLHSSGNLTLMVPWLLPVTAGDTFSVIKGCDKTQTACAATKTASGTATNNLINYGGTDYVPPPTNAI
jgi:uncharacterized phage protein (TIGR02218 family)